MGSKIKTELAISPNAVLEFKKYRNNKIAANILYTAGMVMFQAAVYKDDSDPNPNVRLAYIGLLSNAAWYFINNKANNHLQKSVWHYNQDLLR